MSQAATPTSGSGPSSSGRKVVGLLLVVIAIALVSMTFMMFMRQQIGPTRGGLGKGSPFPPLRAEGWLNGSRPGPDSLKGKVLVVDAWAHWCGPCKEEAPHLVEAYDMYRKRGVVFLGLTRDSEDNIREMKQFLAETKITWPCGYGASTMLDELHNEMIPQVWVVGPDGKIRWNMDEGGSLEAAIDEALASSN